MGSSFKKILNWGKYFLRMADEYEKLKDTNKRTSESEIVSSGKVGSVFIKHQGKARRMAEDNKQRIL